MLFSYKRKAACNLEKSNTHKGGVKLPNILIIDDNPEILSVNTSQLTKDGFGVTAADTGAKAITLLNEKQYDCIVLDIMLPDVDGFSLCKIARTITKVPIIFLSCKDSPDDKIKGLMIGGDDYMTKPYSLKELSARIHAHLRREQTIHLQSYKSYKSYIDGVSIDKDNKMIQTPEKNVFLSQKEFELFMLLFENPEKVFSKEEIYSVVWKMGNSDIGTVAVHVSKLRRKLSKYAAYIGRIETDQNCGYYLALPNSGSVTL